MIRPNPLLTVSVTEKTAANPIVATQGQPTSIQRNTTQEIQQLFFSSLTAAG
jgi:hypothetical protein